MGSHVLLYYWYDRSIVSTLTVALSGRFFFYALEFFCCFTDFTSQKMDVSKNEKLALKVTFFVRPRSNLTHGEPPVRTQVWLVLVLDHSTTCGEVIRRAFAHAEIRLGGARLDDVADKLLMFVQNHGEYFRIENATTPLLDVHEVRQLIDEGKTIINAALATEEECAALNREEAISSSSVNNSNNNSMEASGVVQNDSFSLIRPRSGSLLPDALTHDPVKTTPQLKHRISPREHALTSTPQQSLSSIGEITFVSPLDDKIAVSVVYTDQTPCHVLAERAVAAMREKLLKGSSSGSSLPLLDLLPDPADQRVWSLWYKKGSSGGIKVFRADDAIPAVGIAPASNRAGHVPQQQSLTTVKFYLVAQETNTAAVVDGEQQGSHGRKKAGPTRLVTTSRNYSPDKDLANGTHSATCDETSRSLAAEELSLRRRLFDLDVQAQSLGSPIHQQSVDLQSQAAFESQEDALREIARLRVKKLSLMAQVVECQAAARDCERLEGLVPWFEDALKKCHERQMQLRATLEATALA